MRIFSLCSAALAPLFLIGGWILAAAQQVHFDACVQTISALAAEDARERWIMTAALVGLGLCHLLSALGLQAAYWPGRLMLACGGLCTLLVAAFPLAPARDHRAHVLAASAAFLCLALWPLLAMTRSTSAPFVLRPLGASLGSATLMSLLAWLGWALQRDSYVGLAERVAAAAEALWPLLVAVNVRRTRFRNALLGLSLFVAGCSGDHTAIAVDASSDSTTLSNPDGALGAGSDAASAGGTGLDADTMQDASRSDSALALDADSAHAMDAGMATATDAGSGTDTSASLPAIDCGFSSWSVPFSWTPTSVSMSVLQTKANSAVERYIGSPEVIDRGAVWDLFYAMNDGAKVGRIGHATSSDRGRTWTRTDTLLEPYGSYASGFLDTPTALFEQGQFRVYVFGNSKANVAANPDFPTPGGQIGEVGYAANAWTFVTPELSLKVGAPDAWDGLWIESPVVKRVGAQYFMWYTANDKSWTVRHGVATSADGKTWEKFSENPVVSPSTDNTRFDSFFPGGPAVVRAPDGTFLMFFACAARASAILPPLIANLCLATSPANDGKRFQLYPSNAAPAPIVPRAYFESLSEQGLRVVNGPINPSVVLDREQGLFKLYYENQASHVGLITLPVCRGM